MTLESVIRPEALHELMETAQGVPDGDFVEVGVYKGGSATVLAGVAHLRGRRLFLFDTFTGIPFRDDERDAHKIGDFSDTTAEAVRTAIPEAYVVEGVFPDTLTDDVGPIAFAHVDCDQYQSVRDCCLSLGPRMVPGGIMVFDDYDALPGAKAAVEECFPGRVEISPQGKARVTF